VITAAMAHHVYHSISDSEAPGEAPDNARYAA
jgi:hypothetical protein